MKKRITVFGGSTPRPNDPSYLEALKLGARIGSAGYAVLTGGYSGTMEAVSRGASESGGHVIGVTCDDLEVWRPLPPNEWVAEEMRYKTLRARMYALMDNCDLAIALPGGIGTLAEIAAMWSSLQTGELDLPPLIVVGDGWLEVFNMMRQKQAGYVRAVHWDLIEFVPDIDSAFEKAQLRLEQAG